MLRLNFFNNLNFSKPKILEQIFGYSVFFYVSALIVERLFPGFLGFSFDVPMLFFLPFSLLSLLIITNLILEHTNFYIYKGAKNLEKISFLFSLLLSVVFVSFFLNSDYFFTFSHFVLVVFVFLWVWFVFLYNNGRLSKKYLNISSCLLLLAILLVAAWNFLTPKGNLELNISPSSGGHVISYYSGEDTIVGENASGKYRIITAPEAILLLQVPRAFKKADIEVTYNTSVKSNIYLSTKNIYGTYSQHLINSYNKTLENLPVYWHRIESDNKLILFEKDIEFYSAYRSSLISLDEYLDTREDITSQNKHNIISQYSIAVKSSYGYQQLADQLTEQYNLNIEDITHYKSFQEISNFKPSYNSLSEFTKESSTNILNTFIYQASLDNQFKIEDSTNLQNTYDLNTRGQTSLLLYKYDDAPLDLHLWYADYNKHNNLDSIELLLSQGTRTLSVDTLEDDDNQSDDGRIKQYSDVKFFKKGLSAGLYRLRVKTTDDIFFKKILSNTALTYEGAYYSAESSLYKDIEESSGKKIVLYTNSTNIDFSTSHEQSLQTIKVNEKPVRVDNIQNYYKVSDLPGVTKIEFSGDLRIRGDGVFTFSELSPFLKYKNTTSRSLDDDSVLGTYKYIYGQYLQPFNQKDGWEISRLSIEVPDIAFNKNTVDMRLTFDRNFEDGNIIKIKNIKVQLSKDPLTIGKLVGKIKSLFK